MTTNLKSKKDEKYNQSSKKENEENCYVDRQWQLLTYLGGNKPKEALRVFSNILVALLIVLFATNIKAQDIPFH